MKIAAGGFVPVEREIWQISKTKLLECDALLDQLKNASDVNQYENIWGVFIDSIEVSWTHFYEEGKTQYLDFFKTWVAETVKVRKSDLLLNYITESRHQYQHGVLPLEWDGPKVVLGATGGRFYGGGFNLNGTQELVQPEGISDKLLAQFEMHLSVPKLPVITNKKTKLISQPPKVHLGLPLTDASPPFVGRIAVSYYRNILNSAILKFIINR